MKTFKFTAKRVREKTNNLRTDAAEGPDGIGPMLLKELSTGLTPALVMIFTKSMESGQVLADWMEANSTPTFKKGSKSSPGNYRTVSLTAVRCKFTESVVRDAVTAHLT